MTIRIRCETWGGITGHRIAYLKSNGAEIVFHDRASAEAEAKRLTDRIGGNPYRVAEYRYTVVEE